MHRDKIEVEGVSVPVTAANTIIVGAGAAGMACAAYLGRFWARRGLHDAAERMLVVTGGQHKGASRQSGSDKQTYYKMGTSPRVPDTAEDFAKALTAFGCCHGDTALVEGIASLRGFYNLVEAGVPFPHDPLGAFVGYKTDHDPYERATSAGPKTSKFMSECLQAQVQQMGVRIVDRQMVVKFLTSGTGPSRRIVAMVCIDGGQASETDLGLSVYVAENWVLAAGGPGELYEATVYPHGQIGIHAPALEAGLEACNLTESQFGLASTQFRWNVSGTYMQALPRIYSTDADGGDEREFLADYFADLPSMATNIFLKGYQWPFDAQRITDKRGVGVPPESSFASQSSLIDMAVHQETTVRGRRVWMDFTRNPVGRAEWGTLRVDRLGAEAVDYLRKAGAVQPTPILRLEHMNPPAITIYAEHGIDLKREPLEIALCAQHNNGGFAVNTWWESNIAHTFVVGEMAGTHGVKRPGGAALNAGQVGAMRAAEYIANVYGTDVPAGAASSQAMKQTLGSAVRELRAWLEKGKDSPHAAADAIQQIRRRMTRFGAHLRSKAGAAQALGEAVAQIRQIQEQGLSHDPFMPWQAIEAVQQCLTHVAFLKAIDEMLRRGAGSRGSHCVLDAGGAAMHPLLIDPATKEPYRFLGENVTLREQVLCLRHDPQSPDLFAAWDVPARPIPHRDAAFEVAWAQFRSGQVFRA